MDYHRVDSYDSGCSEELVVRTSYGDASIFHRSNFSHSFRC